MVSGNNFTNLKTLIQSLFLLKKFFFNFFRLLQFNLFNSTSKPGRPDSIALYDGDIYNVTAKKIDELYVNSHLEKKLFRSTGPSLSVKLFATGASNAHGFIAEVVTLPISAIGFSEFENNLKTTVYLFK